MRRIFYKPINRRSYDTLYSKKDISETIEKRYNILLILIVVILLVIIATLFYVQIVQNEVYQAKVDTLNQNIIEGSSAPRGRIYDRNHKLIVDNTPTKIIYYKKPSGVTTKQELDISYQLGELIELNFSKLSTNMLKTFYIAQYPDEVNDKITEKEWKQNEERKLTDDEIEDLKYERITDEDLSIYTDVDKEAAYIYYLMNKGYSYAEKTIKKDEVTDEEYALINENLKDLKGVGTRLDWDRTYPYGSVFRSILGSVSSSEQGLPAESKDEYLEKGYSLNDRVGLSYIEYQYEDILKGEKNLYQVNANGENTLYKEGKRGNDIVLTIDIELQKAVEEILTEEVLKAKSEANTKFYNRSFVIITDPNTGEILAMAGKQAVENDSGGYDIVDYTPGILTSPVVMGSVVKGASQIVGYNTGALEIGENRYDTCVKIAATPIKCSWKYLGRLNDITALKYSSNTYQFYTAIKVGGGTYQYDKPLSVNPEAFDIYRNTFAEFGLGVKTGIDLPVESLGYKGTSTQSGHLLDFSIGQYDTYTPIQLAQYIGTIANNGSRMQPYLLKEVYEPTKDGLTEKIDETTPTELNKVNTTQEFLDRVKLGFQEVMKTGGTGTGYINLDYKPAGKTGTSESFVDSDGDGVVDTETVTNTFAGYAPYDDPKVAFVVISPDIYYQEGYSTYQTTVNKRITTAVTNKYFELYPNSF